MGSCFAEGRRVSGLAMKAAGIVFAALLVSTVGTSAQSHGHSGGGGGGHAAHGSGGGHGGGGHMGHGGGHGHSGHGHFGHGHFPHRIRGGIAGSVIYDPDYWAGLGYPADYPPEDDDIDPTDIDGPPAVPPELVVPGRPAAIPHWYYCAANKSFFPYVADCKAGWQNVAIFPPPPGRVAPPSFDEWASYDDPKGFYPYVPVCRRPWKAVAVSIPQGSPPVAPPVWPFCRASQQFFPYARTCKYGWRFVPAVPPPSMGAPAVAARSDPPEDDPQ